MQINIGGTLCSRIFDLYIALTEHQHTKKSMFFEFILFSPCNLSEIIVYCKSTNLSIYEVENGCKLQKIIQIAD